MRPRALIILLAAAAPIPAACGQPPQPSAAAAPPPTTTAATRPTTAPKPLTEPEKIDRLLQHIASLENAKFIRNGTEHSAKDAADHLRTKQRNAGNRITTAKGFIDHLATKSSLSGAPYQIRLPTGQTVNAGPYLHDQLKQIRATKVTN